jgi:hypothetical protein
MAAAFPTVVVSLVYMLWGACRRPRRRLTPPVQAPAEGPAGDEHVEYRLDCLTILVRPLPRRPS